MSTLAAIRLRDLDYWKDHLTGHSSILLKNNNIPSKTDYCMPTEHMATPFHTLIPKRDEWTSATPGQEGALSFYTDGSKLDNQSQYAADLYTRWLSILTYNLYGYLGIEISQATA
ncbi:hypothetical protein ACLKA6_019636 [Drosophila palustris]